MIVNKVNYVILMVSRISDDDNKQVILMVSRIPDDDIITKSIMLF